MDKAKRKHSEFRVIWWRFLGLWVLGAVVGWLVSYCSFRPIYSGGGSGWSILNLTVIPGFFIALFQAVRIRHTPINPFRWFFAPTAGQLLTAIIYGAGITSIIAPNMNRFVGASIGYILIFGLPAILQWFFVLRRKIRWSWLWPIFVTFVYGLASNIIPAIIEYDSMTFFNWSPLWIGIVSNLINGTFMLFLMNQTQGKRRQLATSSPPIEPS